MPNSMTEDAQVTAVRDSRGKYIGSGISGIIEYTSNGTVIKSPWPGNEEDQCKQDIEVEAQVYRMLYERFGDHGRFLHPVTYNHAASTLTMPYMKTGSLRAYINSNQIIDLHQRLSWCLAMAEGLELVHSLGIIHCDFGPQNLLLDQDLGLKIIDFACASIDGRPSSGGGASRFYPFVSGGVFAVHHDLFALGSSIYETMNGHAPFHDRPSEQVCDLFTTGHLPDLTNVAAADIIDDCWHFRASSADAVRRRLLRIAA